jgi:gluconolactonase
VSQAPAIQNRPASSPFVTREPEFAEVLGDAPRLVRVAETDAHEGPVYVPGHDALYFTTLPRRDSSDVPRVQIKRVAPGGEPAVVRADTNAANGMTLGRDGRLLVCEQGTPSTPARITALDPVSGGLEVVVDGSDGTPLSSPNDIVQARDGSIWFTDPTYGWLQGFRPRPEVGDRVYRYDPASGRLRVGRLRVVADSLDKPNGLALSPDESVLYVTDSGANQEPGSFYPYRPHHVVAFDVTGDGDLVRERVFAEIAPGFPDGIKCDAEGRVYVSSASGVQVFSPSGDRLGEIALAGAVNFTFGGPAKNVLFITTDTAVYGAELEAKGA